MKPTKRSYKDLLKIAGLEIPLKQLAAPRQKWMKGRRKILVTTWEKLLIMDRNLKTFRQKSMHLGVRTE